MKCYIENILCDNEISTDIKELIPDAMLRRRMSKVVKGAVSTAVECAGGIGALKDYDAIITATGWGCLADSEKFLMNMIGNDEELLNPTPFIQSTFNTPGGQIALLNHNHCYNVTYVNRSHSFEDALLDAFLRIEDEESKRGLVGAFDEQIESSRKILQHLHSYDKYHEGEGCAFLTLSSEKKENSLAEIVKIDFPKLPMSEADCREKYCSREESVLLYNDLADIGVYPTASAKVLAKAVKKIKEGAGEVVVFNSVWSTKRASVVVIKCI